MEVELVIEYAWSLLIISTPRPALVQLSLPERLEHRPNWRGLRPSAKRANGMCDELHYVCVGRFRVHQNLGQKAAERVENHTEICRSVGLACMIA